MNPSPWAFSSTPPWRSTIRRTMALCVAMTLPHAVSPASTARVVESSMSENTIVMVPGSTSAWRTSRSAARRAQHDRWRSPARRLVLGRWPDRRSSPRAAHRPAGGTTPARRAASCTSRTTPARRRTGRGGRVAAHRRGSCIVVAWSVIVTESAYGRDEQMAAGDRRVAEDHSGALPADLDRLDDRQVQRGTTGFLDGDHRRGVDVLDLVRHAPSRCTTRAANRLQRLTPCQGGWPDGRLRTASAWNRACPRRSRRRSSPA